MPKKNAKFHKFQDHPSSDLIALTNMELKWKLRNMSEDVQSKLNPTLLHSIRAHFIRNANEGDKAYTRTFRIWWMRYLQSCEH